MNDLIAALLERYPDMDQQEAEAIASALAPILTGKWLLKNPNLVVGEIRIARAAYAAGVKVGLIEGFMNSSEGFNGEYPFDGDVEEYRRHLAARGDRT